jgi:FtsZ-binding cell division protein ZapB
MISVVKDENKCGALVMPAKRVIYQQPQVRNNMNTRTIIITTLPPPVRQQQISTGYAIRRPVQMQQQERSAISPQLNSTQLAQPINISTDQVSIASKRSASSSPDWDSAMLSPPRKRERLVHLSADEKMYRRKMKNRIAAQTARDRKKMKMSQLEEHIQQLEENNHDLADENEDLRYQNDQLRIDNEQIKKQQMEKLEPVSSDVAFESAAFTNAPQPREQATSPPHSQHSYARLLQLILQLLTQTCKPSSTTCSKALSCLASLQQHSQQIQSLNLSQSVALSTQQQSHVVQMQQLVSRMLKPPSNTPLRTLWST